MPLIDVDDAEEEDILGWSVPFTGNGLNGSCVSSMLKQTDVTPGAYKFVDNEADKLVYGSTKMCLSDLSIDAYGTVQADGRGQV
eukprot:5205556-Prymnesium_polylepis.1